jgi:nucleoid DNA-binding protein
MWKDGSMDRRQLVAAAARHSDLTQRQMNQALEALLKAVGEALAAGEAVSISSFGRFEVREYPGRKLRRFDGPGHYTVQERRVPIFKSSAALRRRVKGEIS